MDREYVGIRQATQKGYIECEIGGVADFSYPTSKLRRGRVQGGHVCPTLTSQSMGTVKEDFNKFVDRVTEACETVNGKFLGVSYPNEDTAVILYRWSDGLH